MTKRRRSPAPRPAPFSVKDLAAAVAAELAKAAPPLPSGAISTQLSPAYLAALGQGQARRQLWGDPNVAFGPGVPVPPAFIDPIEDRTGHPLPRRSEYPISWNLPGGNNRMVPWTTLRQVADTVDLVRRCIEIRKNEICSLDWDFTLTPNALDAATTENKGDVASASASLREQYSEEIEALRAFWSKPDTVNGFDFEEWVGVALEEHFVLDALAIFPHRDLKGDLHSLEVIDGSTIKPLLDHRGSIPQAPNPAYQQILHGFPRGEFYADPPETVDAQMDLDSLVYRPRYRRVWTPYGNSPVEQALITTDLYLKRQEWLRSEYTDGTVSELLIQTNTNLPPDLLYQYEAVFNDDLAGQARARHRAKLLAEGMIPWQPQSFEARYKPDLDEYILKILCSAFDVMPTELGFVMAKAGLGGKGHQDGEKDTHDRKATKPLAGWLTGIINHVSRAYLGMSDAITFTFPSLEEESKAEEDEEGAQLTTGRITLNETRDAAGLPRYDFEEADKPFLITATGPIFLEGTSAKQDAQAEATVASSQAVVDNGGIAPVSQDESPQGTQTKPPGSKPKQPAKPSAAESAKVAEARAFIRWAGRRKNPGRPFTFEHFDEGVAYTANKMAAAGDPESAKAALTLALAADYVEKIA